MTQPIRSTVAIAAGLVVAILAGVGVVSGVGQAAQTPPADLVLAQRPSVTLDATMPEAQALASRGGKIVASARTRTSRSTSGRRRR